MKAGYRIMKELTLKIDKRCFKVWVSVKHSPNVQTKWYGNY